MKTHLLVVEGKSDKLFFEAFINHLDVNCFKVATLGGWSDEKVKAQVKTLTRSEYKWIGFAIDIDDNKKDIRTKTILDSFKENQIEIKTSIQFLPSNSSQNGELEDLLIKICNDSDNHWECVEQFKTCISSKTSLNPSLSKPLHHLFTLSKAGLNDVEKKLKDDKHFFWNLNSEELKELKEFLESSKNA